MSRKLRNKIFSIAALFIFCVMGICSAEAALNRREANFVWSIIAEAAGLKYIPLQFDPSPKMNAWVRFESKSKFAVFVTQGLLNALERPGELAGILGHEAAHITEGHYTKTVGQTVGIGLAAEILGNSDNTLLQILGLGGLLLTRAGFSREQEVEADDVGAQIAHKAGYGAWGLHNAMVRLKQKGVTTERSGFNSHPPTDRRLERLYRKAAELKANEEKQKESERLKAEQRTPEQAYESPVPVQQSDNEKFEARYQALVDRFKSN